jgi:hypothetical protein
MVDLVLIDDDVLIHGTWNMVARLKNHRLTCVCNLDEFFGKNIPVQTPIYIDYHFQSGDNGMELAVELYQKGYKKLYITTGSTTHVGNKPDEIVAILGKDYPL